jgi:S-adenosylmethionine synthetase
MYKQFVSESVASGHPDKICDQISDAILDECLRKDANSRVAIETLVTKNKVVLAGEVSCSEKIEYEKIARKTIFDLGYDQDIYEFNHWSPISVYINEQSSDIAMGVDNSGAGDQGMMFGFASNETPELMPLPIMLAHQLVKSLDDARENQIIPYLRPDGKAEVVVNYENASPMSVPVVIMAAPHDPKVSKKELTHDLTKKVIEPSLCKYFPKLTVDFPKIIINGTGKWEVGGPASDTGVTGRKIIVDTYGGIGRHGGGCFSGKDATKVDRSGAYACRFLAKNTVAAGLADKCEVQIAYVIGKKNPLVVDFNTFGTSKKSDLIIKSFINKILNLSVSGIIKELDLKKPIYKQTARYGHFGNETYSWEKIIKL